MAQVDFEDFVSSNFTKRFGSSFSSRAENLSKALSAAAWSDYNNFKSLGAVLTLAQVLIVLPPSKTSI
jgi:hypothetical protein